MSASGDFGPAPAGVDLGENQNGDIFGPVVALMVVSSIFIITRFVTRIVGRTGGVSLDDYLIVVGWVSLLAVDSMFFSQRSRSLQPARRCAA